MTPTLKVASPAELLATIPALLGTRPEQSVVIVVTRDGATGALRIDLPDDDARLDHKQAATHVLGMLSRVSGARRLHVAVFTDHDIRDSLPHRAFVETLLGRLGDGGFAVGEALCHASNGWGCYHDPELPHGGHPLTEITQAEDRMPGVGEREPMIAETPAANPEEVKRTRDAMARYDQLLRNATDDDELPELDPLCDVPRFVETALDWNDADLDRHGALLLFAIQGPAIRDSTMLQWAFGFDIGDACYEENARVAENGIDTAGEASHVFASLLMGHGPRPNQARMNKAIRVLLTLVGRVEGDDRLAPLCMLAWLSWALGRGSHAGRFIAAALAIDPGYGMADVLHTLTSSGLLPEWVFLAPDEHPEVA